MNCQSQVLSAIENCWPFLRIWVNQRRVLVISGLIQSGKANLGSYHKKFQSVVVKWFSWSQSLYISDINESNGPYGKKERYHGNMVPL